MFLTELMYHAVFKINRSINDQIPTIFILQFITFSCPRVKIVFDTKTDFTLWRITLYLLGLNVRSHISLHIDKLYLSKLAVHVQSVCSECAMYLPKIYVKTYIFMLLTIVNICLVNLLSTFIILVCLVLLMSKPYNLCLPVDYKR